MEEQRRLYYLEKMGIQAWVARASQPQDIPAESGQELRSEQATPPTQLVHRVAQVRLPAWMNSGK